MKAFSNVTIQKIPDIVPVVPTPLERDRALTRARAFKAKAGHALEWTQQVEIRYVDVDQVVHAGHYAVATDGHRLCLIPTSADPWHDPLFRPSVMFKPLTAAKGTKPVLRKLPVQEGGYPMPEQLIERLFPSPDVEPRVGYMRTDATDLYAWCVDLCERTAQHAVTLGVKVEPLFRIKHRGDVLDAVFDPFESDELGTVIPTPVPLPPCDVGPDFPREVAFSAAYIRDALKGARGPVRVWWGDGKSPLLIARQDGEIHKIMCRERKERK